MVYILISLMTMTLSISEANMKELKPCPDSPNCVSTKTDQKSKKMDPVPYTESSEEAKQRIKNLVSKLERTELVEDNANYLHFTFKSRLFGFVDDVEFLLDDEKKLIHFRSASRTGYGDMGVNRKRMEKISKQLLK